MSVIIVSFTSSCRSFTSVYIHKTWHTIISHLDYCSSILLLLIIISFIFSIQLLYHKQNDLHRMQIRSCHPCLFNIFVIIITIGSVPKPFLQPTAVRKTCYLLPLQPVTYYDFMILASVQNIGNIFLTSESLHILFVLLGISIPQLCLADF